jgi:hypothetical protein
MIGDRKREFSDSGGLGMKIEKDPAQIRNMGTIYTFGESSTEVDLVKVDKFPKGHPFARIEDSELTRQ